jgi:hypothetical protein
MSFELAPAREVEDVLVIRVEPTPEQNMRHMGELDPPHLQLGNFGFHIGWNLMLLEPFGNNLETIEQSRSTNHETNSKLSLSFICTSHITHSHVSRSFHDGKV